MLERINNAFASVRTFTGNASHELRTPISLLRTEIEVALLRPRESEEYRAILSRLRQETVRMTNLVDNLLSLARADGGAEAISIAPINVGQLFCQLSDTWSATMIQAKLEFKTECMDENLSVLGDVHGIQRLLSILLENASKYTPPEGLVTLRAVSSMTFVVLSVEDTGMGISAEDLPRIFDRFYRAVPMSESTPSGSGLGLSLAKWIAERHGSELKVESKPGGGSSFSIQLTRVTK
jgi:signal transduction histidine kinase